MKTMKRLILILTILLFVSCQNDEMYVNTQETVDNTVLRECATDEILESQLVTDPTLANRMNTINEFVKIIKKNSTNSKMINGQIVIPVVVNIVYNQNLTTVYLGKTYLTENIGQYDSTNAQIKSQIAALNRDFNSENTNFPTNTIFSDIRGTVGIRFVLDTIIRKASNVTIWTANERSTSFDKVKTGLPNDPSTGISPTNPTTKLNIWVCNTDVKGYAQFPGGNVLTDGIVVSYKWFGDFSGTTNGTSNLNLFKPYSCAAGSTNLGRTAVHEIGHWLNVRHIFADRLSTSYCSSEFPTGVVDDTPSQPYPSSGTPVYPTYSTCPGTPIQMTMNFMDYTSDKGKSMFTKGQVTIMKSMFLTGGARESFTQ